MIRVIIKDIRNNTQKTYDIDEQTTVEQLLNLYQPHSNACLSYQNIIMENNRTLAYYSLPNDSLLYVCPVAPTTQFFASLPQFMQTAANGDFIIPFIENLINQNAELLDTIERDLNSTVRILIRSGQNGQPFTQSVRIQRRVQAPTQNTVNIVSENVQRTIGGNTVNVRRQDLQSRRDLQTQLNLPAFQRILQTSREHTYEPRYDVEYNAAMIFIQSWINTTITTFNSVLPILTATSNLLNNHRMVLSEQTLNQFAQLYRTMGTYMTQISSILTTEFNNRRNQTLHRVAMDVPGNQHISQEPVSDDDDTLWRSFSQAMEIECYERDEALLLQALEEVSQVAPYELIANGRVIPMSEEMSVEEITKIIDELREEKDHN